MKKTLLKTNFAVAVALAAALAAEAQSFAGWSQERRCSASGAEICAMPRRKTAKTVLPDEAHGRLFLGTGVYPCGRGLYVPGFCFTNWSTDRLDAEADVDLCAREELGNTVQLWANNQRFYSLARRALTNGLYTTCIYTKAPQEIAGRLLPEFGEKYLGYDFGERFSLTPDTSVGVTNATLTAIADRYVQAVRDHVAERHAGGWGNVMATSSNFGLDYEVAAGTEIPCTEDFPYGDLTLASAQGRGLYRQYDLPLWGSHLAHDWYSFLPLRNPRRMDSLRTALQLKYMTGAKIIILESGNQQVQTTLCEDPPMSHLPIVGRRISTKLDKEGREKYEKPVAEEAYRKSAYIDFRSPVATKYRRILREFYDFCRAHPAPKGQPEATWAIAKGNLDLGEARYVPGAAIAGAYAFAGANPNWMPGLPEMSWETLRKAVMPQPPMFLPNRNFHFSASPYGLCDLVSFAFDNVTAGHLLRNYKVLMFAGWNTCSPKQYRILCDYVKGGGILVIGLCHLSTDDRRNYTDPTVEGLVNGGDLTELCGVRVKGRTGRKYWATGPSTEPNALGFVARRRFGYMYLPLGELEYVAPKESFEELAVDDEEAEPFILRCRNGKGQVLLMNWWAYPAAANAEYGPGALDEQIGMVGYLYRYAAKLGRGNVFITGPDFENPDEDCNWILCSYFPDEGKVYLLNLDYENERKCVLQQFGDKDFLTLKPAEFRIVDSVKLDPSEKLNAE